MLLHSETHKSTFKFIDAVTYIMPAREAYRILIEICSFWPLREITSGIETAVKRS